MKIKLALIINCCFFINLSIMAQNNVPVLVYNSAAILCEGNPLRLTVTPTIPPGYKLADDTNIYNWDTPAGVGWGISANNSEIIGASIAGEYKVQVLLENIVTGIKIWSQYSNVITVYSNPESPQFNTTYHENCGSNVKLTPDNASSLNGSTLFWLNTNKQPINEGIEFITPSLNTSKKYYVYAQNEYGCKTAQVPVDVMIDKLPNPSIVSSGLIIRVCKGDTVVLKTDISTNAPYTVNWYDIDDQLLATGLRYKTLPIEKEQKYKATFINKDGTCETNPDEITVSPTIKINAPKVTNTTICEGSKGLLSAASNNINTNNIFYWYLKNNNELYRIGNNILSPKLTADTTFYVKEIIGNCQSDSVELTISIKPLKEPIGSNITVCENSPATLVANKDPDNGFINSTLRWLNSNGELIKIGNTLIIENIKKTQSVWVMEYLNEDCFSHKTEIQVIKNPRPFIPVISIVGNEFCEGDSVKIELKNNQNNNNTIWTKPSLEKDNNLTLNNLSLSDMGVYSVQYQDNVGCLSEITTFYIKVKSKPQTPVIKVPQTVCPENRVITLKTQNILNAQYLWTKTANDIRFATSNTAFYNVTVTSSEIYGVKVLVDGCESFINKASVKLINKPQVQLLNQKTICEGDDLIVEITDNDDNYFYQWKGPDNYESNRQDLIIYDVSLNNAGVYMLNCSTKEGCEMEQEITININQGPKKIAITDEKKCEGDYFQGFDLSSIAGFGYKEEWDFPDGEISNSSQINTVEIYHNGEYLLTLEDTNTKCKSEPISCFLSVNFKPDRPDVYYIINEHENNVTFNVLSDFDVRNFLTIQNDDGITKREVYNNQITDTFKVGKYSSYSISNVGGCVSDDADIILEEYILPEVYIPDLITPNAQGALKTWRISYLEDKNYTLTLFDSNGHFIRKWENNFPKEGWDTKNDDNEFKFHTNTYYYILDINDKKYKGVVSIILN